MNKVSIIVPVFNVALYLERCVQSLLRQNYPNYEIILIDDCSTDGSGEMCDRLAGKNDKIRVIHHSQNAGLSAARNSGIDAACGDFIAFVDSDDFVKEDFLLKMMKLAAEFDAQLVQCGYEKGSADCFSERQNLVKVQSFMAKEALCGYWIKSQACCKLYKKELFDGIRFPVGLIHEDEYVTYKLVYRSKTVAVTTDELYYYYQRPNSIMGNVTNVSAQCSRRNDWILAYVERIAFFEKENEPQLVYRTYEKVCIDIILRYAEMLRVKSEINESRRKSYHRNFKRCYPLALKKEHIPLKRKLFYTMFRYVPKLTGRIAAQLQLRG